MPKIHRRKQKRKKRQIAASRKKAAEENREINFFFSDRFLNESQTYLSGDLADSWSCAVLELDGTLYNFALGDPLHPEKSVAIFEDCNFNSALGFAFHKKSPDGEPTVDFVFSESDWEPQILVKLAGTARAAVRNFRKNL